MIAQLPVMGVESDCCWKEGPPVILLCAFRIILSATEGALPLSSRFIHGVEDIVHHGCYFTQSPSVSHYLHWVEGATQLAFLSCLFNHFLSAVDNLWLQHTAQ